MTPTTLLAFQEQFPELGHSKADPRWFPGGPEGRPRRAAPGPAFPLHMRAPAAALRSASARCTSSLSGEGLGIEPGDAVRCR